jgi:hypothetical protein
MAARVLRNRCSGVGTSARVSPEWLLESRRNTQRTARWARRASRRAQHATDAESSPGRQHGSAKRAAQDATIGNFTSVLSAGANLRNDRRTRRVKAFRHGLMRHFLRRELGAPIAIPSLPGCLQKATAVRSPVQGSSASDGLTTLLWGAQAAETPSPITPSTKSKLGSTTSARNNPKSVRRHELRTADYWTWSSGRDEGAVLRRQNGDPEGS